MDTVARVLIELERLQKLAQEEYRTTTPHGMAESYLNGYMTGLRKTEKLLKGEPDDE